ncbi:MAG: PD-(D/E)XK nuclease family protein [Prevotella sp.]|nr:PD-(D/E)XK nuclease family protein [Prevotella sp.]
MLPDIEAIFSPDHIHDHSDYYLQALLYSDIVRRKSQYPVVPALLFIQHAGGDDYDPTLQLAQQPISDVAEHSEKYCRLLDAMVREIFSSDTPFVPTQDRRTCQYCPYASLCR